MRALCGRGFVPSASVSHWEGKADKPGPGARVMHGLFQQVPVSGAVGLRHAVTGTQTVTPSGDVKNN